MIDPLVRALAGEELDPPEPVPPGVSVRRGRLIPMLGGLLSGMGRPAAAVTLGRTIVVHPGVLLTTRLLRHEMAHVRQWQAHPLTFAARYVLGHVRYGYHANPFEVEARAAEDRPAG
ncbi:MAG: DUF4157 domain-containing protein [Gemmatimonadetes bacterium]|nr:DUF4157 domain-containing protein [Gemmatimonadota bacterium]